MNCLCASVLPPEMKAELSLCWTLRTARRGAGVIRARPMTERLKLVGCKDCLRALSKRPQLYNLLLMRERELDEKALKGCND